MHTRRSFIKVFSSVAVMALALPSFVSKAAGPLFQRTISRRRKRLPANKTWIGGSGDFSDPDNWQPWGPPSNGDSITLDGGELTLPNGLQLRRLDVHQGTLRTSSDCRCCIDEFVVYPSDGGDYPPSIGVDCGKVHIVSEPD